IPAAVVFAEGATRLSPRARTSPSVIPAKRGSRAQGLPLALDSGFRGNNGRDDLRRVLSRGLLHRRIFEHEAARGVLVEALHRLARGVADGAVGEIHPGHR